MERPIRKYRLRSKSGAGKSGGAKTGGHAPSGGAKRKRASKAQLKRELHKLFRHHGMSVAHSKAGISHLEGAGFFDVLKKIGSTVANVVRKGVDLYGKHKDTIHKGIELAKEYAPQAIEAYKAIKGGGKKRRAPKALGQWREKVMAYKARHGCTLKEAMQALKGK